MSGGMEDHSLQFPFHKALGFELAQCHFLSAVPAWGPDVPEHPLE